MKSGTLVQVEVLSGVQFVQSGGGASEIENHAAVAVRVVDTSELKPRIRHMLLHGDHAPKEGTTVDARFHKGGFMTGQIDSLVYEG